MANEQNLTRAGIEIDSREKAQKLGRLGGIASGPAKRRKKNFRELAQFMLDHAADKNIKKRIAEVFPQIADEDLTYRSAILAAQIAKSAKGDTVAAAFVRDTGGEKPVDRVMQEGIERIQIEVVTGGNNGQDEIKQPADTDNGCGTSAGDADNSASGRDAQQ